jgi:hypothetical protein
MRGFLTCTQRGSGHLEANVTLRSRIAILRTHRGPGETPHRSRSVSGPCVARVARVRHVRR